MKLFTYSSLVISLFLSSYCYLLTYANDDAYGEDPTSDLMGGQNPDDFLPPDPNARPALTQLYSLEEIDSFIKEEDRDPVILGFFDPTTAEEDLETFKQVFLFPISLSCNSDFVFIRLRTQMEQLIVLVIQRKNQFWNKRNTIAVQSLFIHL
jgi:hypothetical protein